MRNLGRAVSILLEYREQELAIADDLYVMGAPSECYALAHKGSVKRYRQVVRHACHIANVRSIRELRRLIRATIRNADAWFYRHYGEVPYC